MSELRNESIQSASFVTAQTHLSASNSHSSQWSSTQIEPRAIAAAEALGGRKYTRSLSQPSLGSATQIEPRVVAYEAALALKEEREAARSALKAPATKEIVTLFNDALRHVSGARMIVASTHFPDDTNQNLSIIPLSYKANKRVTFGVFQQAQDVDLILRFPPNDACTAFDTDIKCQIIYDPGRDECLLVNYTEPQLRLTNFSSSLVPPISIRGNKSHSIQPGMWRISIDDDGEDSGEYHLAEFLLLGRQFHVSIRTADNSSGTKRGIDDDAEKNTSKRRKRNSDLTGNAFMQPINKATIEPGPLITAAKRAKARDLSPSSVSADSLLDLADGDTADIQVLGDGTNKSQSLSGANGPTSYTLRRVEQKGATPSASVFTCQHSAVSGTVVAKVLRYKRDDPDRVRRSLFLWKTEKATLEKLKHRNIVSLKAFDGRTLAIYLEQLSSSLDRGNKAKFSQSDIFTILLDISSALVYLKTIPIIHNDIKPGNITYSPRRGAVLIDFGLATSTNEWRAGGTPKYVPPDVLTYSRGSPGDIWALGITMLYLLGMIQYPERDKKAPNWPIHEVFANEEAQNLMINWLEHVAKARTRLSPVNVGTGRNKLEYTVFNMLERNSRLRFDAEKIISTLDSSTRS